MATFSLDGLFERPASKTAELVVVDVFNLEQCMADHVSLFAQAVGEYEDVKAQAAAARADLEFQRAQAFRSIRAEDPRIALGTLEKLAVEHVSVQRQMKKVLELERKTGILRGLTTALEHRRDMIVQISARQRQEIVSNRTPH